MSRSKPAIEPLSTVANRPATLFLDVTETYHSHLRTGIQRVSIETLRRVEDIASAAGLEPGGAIVCDVGSGLPIEFDLDRFGWDDSSNGVDRREVDADGITGPRGTLFRMLSGAWSLLIRAGLSPILSSEPVSRLVGSIRARLLGLDRTAGQVHPQAGDVVFVVDSFWGAPNRLRYFKKLRTGGVRVVFMCYDLIPLTHPEYVDGLNIVGFAKSLKRALDNADLILTISDFTKNELRRLYPESTVPMQTVWLGSDLAATQNANAIHASTRKPNSILVLGTVEPRKNHSLILDWFESPDADAYSLTIVGKPGWETDHLQRRMNILQQQDKRFIWCKNATDSELAKLLQEHEIGVQASCVEGFGLPIWEMAHNGMILVVSDIPVFREISPPEAHFFDPNSIRAFSGALAQATNKDQAAANTSVLHGSFFQSWDDYSTKVAKAIRAL